MSPHVRDVLDAVCSARRTVFQVTIAVQAKPIRSSFDTSLARGPHAFESPCGAPRKTQDLGLDETGVMPAVADRVVGVDGRIGERVEVGGLHKTTCCCID